jgi:hypothetical protein
MTFHQIITLLVATFLRFLLVLVTARLRIICGINFFASIAIGKAVEKFRTAQRTGEEYPYLDFFKIGTPLLIIYTVICITFISFYYTI